MSSEPLSRQPVSGSMLRIAGSTEPNEIAAVALHLFDRYGLVTIPVNGKKAIGAWKRWMTQKPTRRQVEAMFKGDDYTGLALILKDGYCCRDFDSESDYHVWAADYPKAAKALPTFRTGRGYQVLIHDPGAEFIDMGEQGELRAGGKHYSVLPPSMHPEVGRRYEWVVQIGEEIPSANAPQLGLIPPEFEQRQSSGAHKAQYGLDVSTQGCTDVNEIILQTQPSGPGTRNRSIFSFVCALRGLPNYRDAKAADARHLIREWYELALPKIRTKDWSVTLSDFYHAWKHYDPSKAGGGVGDALAVAKADRVVPELDPEHNDRLQVLAKLCRELARRSGDMTFFISSRVVEKRMQIPAMTACRYLNTLASEGLIEVIEESGFRAGKRTSREYLYLGEL